MVGCFCAKRKAHEQRHGLCEILCSRIYLAGFGRYVSGSSSPHMARNSSWVMVLREKGRRTRRCWAKRSSRISFWNRSVSTECIQVKIAVANPRPIARPMSKMTGLLLKATMRDRVVSENASTVQYMDKPVSIRQAAMNKDQYFRSKYSFTVSSPSFASQCGILAGCFPCLVLSRVRFREFSQPSDERCHGASRESAGILRRQ